MYNLAGNIRYALRQFRQSPVFTAAAILTLALGIGGTTAIFTLMHAVMLRSLPVSDPSRLYRVGDGSDCCVEGGPQDRWGMFSYPFVERLEASTPEFEDLAAFQAGAARLSVRRAGREEPAKPLRSEYVTGNYFSVLGIQAFGGRLFTKGDDRRAASPVLVLSHQAWEREYGGDRSIVGSTVVVQGHPFTVVGIAPPGFYGETLRGDPPDVWVPLHQEVLVAGSSSLLEQPISAWLRVIGRLRPGASVDGMSARLTTILRNWMVHDADYPANWLPEVQRLLPKQNINVVPAGSGVADMKEQYGRSLQILLSVCGTVLLIACANVANLLLARAVARRTQTSLRLAVGANQAQIVGQALIEAVLLAIGGAITGLVVSILAGRMLLTLAFPEAQLLPISLWPSPVVLGFAFAMALLTGILFGAAPAWFATRTNPVEALRGAGRSTKDQSSVVRKAFLVVQVALSVVLVAGAMMLSRSLNSLENQDFGYAVKDRVVVSLNRFTSSASISEINSKYRRIEEQLQQIPGVRSAGLAMYNPLTDNWGELILVAGHPAPKFSEEAGASWDRVSTHYLQNFGVRLVRGRFFSEADNEHSAPVAIINEAFVKRFFRKDENPLDQHFGLDLPENIGIFRIVGVVKDAKFAGFGLSQPARAMFYVPLTQMVDYKNPLMARLERDSHVISGIMLQTSVAPGVLEPAVKRTLLAVDPNLTVIRVQTMEQQVASTFDQERAVASLAGMFGAVALLLAAIGLYGVTSYSVTQRTGEIGLRIALGADARKVVGHVLGEAFLRVAIGLALGLPLAIGAGKMISSQLYKVSFFDPYALCVASTALAISALIAALIPAGFAASISPMVALRSD